MTDTANLNKGDTIFVISKTQEIKEAKFLQKTHSSDDSIWAMWTEDWDDEEKEGMCFCCQKHQWSTSKADATSKLQEILLKQKLELLE